MTLHHVTNGDVCADALRAAGATPLVIWRDVLHAGPVPAGLSPAQLAAVRASFLAGQSWTDFAEALALFAERDAALARAEGGVLWFEHDLYDQLQLVQVLATLAARPQGVCADIPVGDVVERHERGSGRAAAGGSRGPGPILTV